MRNILFILAALIGFGAFAQTNIPTRQMLADTNGVVKWPTNITRIRIGGTEYTNLLGFGLSVTNGQLSVDTTQLPSGGGSGVVTSVTDDFEIDGGELALTNALGTGPLVRQSAASGFGTVTSVGASTTVSGLGFSGSPVTGSGTLSLTGTVAVASGGTGATDASGARTALSLVPGTDVQAYDVDLAAIAALANSGIIARTGSGTVAARTITGDSEVVVSNGDGVSGNPTLSIGSAIARDSEVTAATAEATLESVLDLQDLQGAVTDAQVPNTITIDQATLALTGDSATSFFSSGEIEDARLPSGLARDSEVSATYAPLASPALTGSPTVPTASAGVSNTLAASTAYVDRAVASGGGGGGSWDGSPTASGTVSNLTTYSINGIPLTKTIARFTASQNQPPASSYATFGTRNSIAFLAFDPTAQESANFITSVPEGYTNTALTVVLHTASTATSGNYRFGAQIARLTGVDIDSDSYATAVEATTATSGTAGLVTSLTLSSIGIDSATEGEFIQINIYRDVSDAADTVNSNDIELIGVEVRGQ